MKAAKSFGAGVFKRFVRVIPSRAWASVYPSRVMVFFYHCVSDSRVQHVAPLHAYKQPSQLEDDLRFARANYTIIGYDQWHELQRESASSGTQCALFTFDDGLTECASVIAPMLEAHGVRGTFFVTTDVVDNRAMLERHKLALCLERLDAASETSARRWAVVCGTILRQPLRSRSDLRRALLSKEHYMGGAVEDICDVLGVDWKQYLLRERPYMSVDQLRGLVARGHSLGAHSTDHVDFRFLTKGEIEQSVTKSCDLVAGWAGRGPVPFAFPFGTTDEIARIVCEVADGWSSVDALFGTSGVAERSGVWHRISADDPRGARRGRSNLPAAIRDSYLLALRADMRVSDKRRLARRLSSLSFRGGEA